MVSFVTKGAGQTDVGRVRSTNQDSFFVNDDNGIYIVADGMGGHAGGEIASRICVEQISDQIVKDKLFS